MSSHLSDEAVAAFADGVLSGHARGRAAKHVESCAECRAAVRSQREAVLALRAAPAPSLPIGLFERLQALPGSTPLTPMPTVTAPDGSFVLSTGRGMAAFVEPQPVAPKSRTHPFVTGVAVVALTAGALAVGSAAPAGGATAGTPAFGSPGVSDARTAASHSGGATRGEQVPAEQVPPTTLVSSLFAGR